MKKTTFNYTAAALLTPGILASSSAPGHTVNAAVSNMAATTRVAVAATATATAKTDTTYTATAKQAALRAVMSLAAFVKAKPVKAGLTYKAYEKRLAQAQAAVDQALLGVPSVNFTTQIKDAMGCYQDAARLWRAAFKADQVEVYLSAIKPQIERYHLTFVAAPSRHKGRDKVFQDTATASSYVIAPLTKIWQVAADSAAAATKLATDEAVRH